MESPPGRHQIQNFVVMTTTQQPGTLTVLQAVCSLIWNAMCEFESSRPNQAVRAFGQNARPAEKGPHSAGFRAFVKVSGLRN